MLLICCLQISLPSYFNQDFHDKEYIIIDIINLCFEKEKYDKKSLFITIDSILNILQINSKRDMYSYLKVKQISKRKFYSKIREIVINNNILQHHSVCNE